MRILFLTTLTILFVFNLKGQASYSHVESKLETSKANDSTELSCSFSNISIKFGLKRNITPPKQKHFVTIDEQTIQIIPLKLEGNQNQSKEIKLDGQKELLKSYMKYELNYFTDELGIEVINPNNQWVIIKSKGWFIWYFRVGTQQTNLDKQTQIQLFASTVIKDNILTINAPIMSDGEFRKAGLIMNEMMESSVITK